MLQFFHKYQKSVVVYLFIGIILFSMVFFGVNMLDTGSVGQYALKVNDQEVSYSAIAERRQTFEAQLRQQFGDAFNTLWEFLSRDLNQRIVDSFIEEKLLDEVSQRQGLGASSGDVKESLLKLFQGQFSPALYQAYLSQRRLTAPQFEEQLAQQIRREQIDNVINDLSVASGYEALHIGQREEGKVDLQFVRFNPKQLTNQVKVPELGALQEYFEQNLSRYELAPRVNYSAIVVNPDDVLAEIKVNQEDIELYYAEHASEYKRPARARVAHIQINYTADSSPEAMNSVRQKAEEVRERALRGEDFNTLVVQYSDDLPTKLVNGSLGWIEEGSRDDGISKAVMAQKKAGVTELVSADYGFHVVNVLEFQEAGNKELGEVAEDIVNKLKQLEAPAFALVKAEDILNRFNESKLSLADFAAKEGLKVLNTDKLLTAEQDIEVTYSGLTAKILESPTLSSQLVELGNSNFVVSVRDFKGTELPEFAAIKEQVQKDWIANAAKELAQQKAEEFLDELRKTGNFKELSDSRGLKVEELKAAGAQTSTSILSDAELRTQALRQGSPGIIGDRVFSAGEDFVVAVVSTIDRPAKDKLVTGIDEYRTRVTQNNFQAVRASLLKSLQAKSEVDIAPGVLTN